MSISSSLNFSNCIRSLNYIPSSSNNPLSSSHISSYTSSMISIHILLLLTGYWIFLTPKVISSSPTLNINLDSRMSIRSLAVFRSGLPRMIGFSPYSFMSISTKLFVKTNFLILTSRSSIIPKGYVMLGFPCE